MMIRALFFIFIKYDLYLSSTDFCRFLIMMSLL